MIRRTEPQWKTDEAYFPVRVRFRVPPFGLGKLTWPMLEWLDGEVGRGDYAWHSAGRNVDRDRFAIHFRHPNPASAFVSAFPTLEIADDTTAVTYTSPRLPYRPKSETDCPMTPDELRQIYRGYIDCLNAQDWKRLGEFVGDAAEYNGTAIGLAGYEKMLIRDFRAIPGLRFNIDLVIAEPPHIASRLKFECTPHGMLFDISVNGKRVRFTENVFYEFKDRRIRKVWSIIDRAAIAAQV